MRKKIINNLQIKKGVLKRLLALFSSALILFSLTGCGGRAQYEKPRTSVKEYEPWTYDTAEVCRGDIEPALELKLKADANEKKTYYPMFDAMEVSSVNVSKGDVVENGTVLVTFKSGDLGDKIKKYQTRAEEDKLLLEHYTNLAKIDSATDYSSEIEKIKNDIEVSNMYIAELEASLSNYNIVAEGSGIVMDVSELLDYGVVSSNAGVVSVKYGTGEFTATTNDDYEFETGQIFEAEYASAIVDVELLEITEDGKDEEGNTIRKLKFKAVADAGSVTSYDTLYLTIYKNVVKDVLYVPKSAVFYVEDESFVYTMDEKGMRHGVKVTVGDTMEGYTVIEAGLSEGEKVVVD